MGSEIVSKKQREVESFGFAGVPTIISAAGKRASFRFVEFFTANIRNENTRVSYGRALRDFCNWCEERGLRLEDLNPVIVAGYIELLGQPLEKNGRGLSSVNYFSASATTISPHCCPKQLENGRHVLQTWVLSRWN